MDSDQQRITVICVSPGLHGRWDISEKGAEKPFASFDEKEDAYAYASKLKNAKPGVTVLVEDDEGFSPLPTQGNGQGGLGGASRPNNRAG